MRFQSVSFALDRWTIALVVLVTSCLFVSCRRDPKQEQVVLYCSADQAVAEPIVAEFQRRTGIAVLARYDTEASKTVGLVQRLRAEADSPAADVFWSSEVFHTIRLANEGVLAECDELPVPADWSDTLIGSDRRWVGFALRARVIAYSTERVGQEQAPKSLEELLDPKWKGRLVMADPQFGTTGGDVASWFAHYGRQRAEEILQGLKDNEVRLVDGNSTAVRMVATGQADVCMTDTDDVHAARRNGWPIAMNPLDQGGDGVLVIPNTVAMIKGGPNPGAARRLMEFLLSKDVERMLVKSDSHNAPVHSDLAAEFSEYSIAHPLEISYAKMAAAMPGAIASVGEILR